MNTCWMCKSVVDRRMRNRFAVPRARSRPSLIGVVLVVLAGCDTFSEQDREGVLEALQDPGAVRPGVEAVFQQPGALAIPQGPQGPQGAAGPQGPAGLQGPPGTDAIVDGGAGIVVTDGTVSLAPSFTNGYFKVGGNMLTADMVTEDTALLGTLSNHAMALIANGMRALRIEPNATSPNLIAGFDQNEAAPGVVGAVVDGGGAADDGLGNVGSNRVYDHFGVIGGGVNNVVGSDDADQANAENATVSGGLRNEASGSFASVGGGHNNGATRLSSTIAGGGENIVYDNYGTIGGGLDNAAGTNNADALDATHATVAGGRNNQAAAFYSTIGGGRSNLAAGWYSTVAGGNTNVAAGYAAMVPGGWGCHASGDRSFAAGRRALASHNGSFVWGDDTDSDFASTAPNQFLIRAVGGVGIGTNAPQKALTVDGDMEIGVNSADYHHMRIGGGNSDGFLYGSFPALADGIHMGYNYYANAAGEHQIIHADGGTSRLSLGYGSVVIATGQAGVVPSDRLIVNSAGQVGIGAIDPSFTLTVVGASNTAVTSGIAAQFSSSDHALIPSTGVFAQSNASDLGVGVWAIANNGPGSKAIWGVSNNGRAGQFDGDVHVNGTLSKSAGSFQIDHPLDPENMYLRHSFVESPEMKNVYDGVVTLGPDARAEVVLPDWFEALNRDFRYQLTAVGGPAPMLHVAREVADNRFEIAGGDPGQRVSWQVTGVRQDAYALAHPIVVEEHKPEAERGLYQHPEIFGQPESKGIGWKEKSAVREHLGDQNQPARGKVEQRDSSDAVTE